MTCWKPCQVKDGRSVVAGVEGVGASRKVSATTERLASGPHSEAERFCVYALWLKTSQYLGPCHRTSLTECSSTYSSATGTAITIDGPALEIGTRDRYPSRMTWSLYGSIVRTQIPKVEPGLRLHADLARARMLRASSRLSAPAVERVGGGVDGNHAHDVAIELVVPAPAVLAGDLVAASLLGRVRVAERRKPGAVPVSQKSQVRILIPSPAAATTPSWQWWAHSAGEHAHTNRKM